MTVIAEETTTLPEGAHLTVAIIQTTRHLKRGPVSSEHLQLCAANSKGTVEMRAQEKPSAHNLRRYLDLSTVQINRERKRIEQKKIKAMEFSKPETFEQFAQSMAHFGMFLF